MFVIDDFCPKLLVMFSPYVRISCALNPEPTVEVLNNKPILLLSPSGASASDADPTAETDVVPVVLGAAGVSAWTEIARQADMIDCSAIIAINFVSFMYTHLALDGSHRRENRYMQPASLIF